MLEKTKEPKQNIKRYGNLRNLVFKKEEGKEDLTSKLRFHSISDEKVDTQKYDKDIDFMIRHGYYWEAGKIALVLGEVDPKYLYIAYEMGEKLFSRGDFKLAAIIYHSLTEFADDSYTKEFLLKRAIEGYKAAIPIERDRPFARYMAKRMGDAYLSLNILDEAMNAYVKAGLYSEAVKVIDMMLKDDRYKDDSDILQWLKRKYKKMEDEKNPYLNFYHRIILNLGKIKKVSR